MTHALSLEELGTALRVSRETLDRFETYGALLKRWQERVNLVGPGTLADMWRTHFLDSGQLWSLVPAIADPRPARLARCHKLAAMPPGARTGDEGYKHVESVPLSRLVSCESRLTNSRKPVLAPIGAKKWLDLGSGAGFPGLVLAIMGAPEVHLVESNQKKAAFLREAARITAAPVIVHCQRIETLVPFSVDVVTARGLTKLDTLVRWAQPFAHAGTVALFPKGQDVDVELTETSKSWIIDIERHASRSDTRGVILCVRGLVHARKHPN